MLLAIDVGNTHCVFGVWNGSRWVAQWRHATDPETTEDQLGAWLRTMFEMAGLPWKVEQVVCACVVPPMVEPIRLLSERWLGVPATFLRDGAAFGLTVLYEPPTSVGADRLANALGALSLLKPPLIVVDFGTGTNFDAVDRDGRYVGGAIMPGILVGSEALFRRAAKLPHVDGLSLRAPERAIGRSTVQSLQSGIVLGYAAAIDGLVAKMDAELGGGSKVVATGGLGGMFLDLCDRIESFQTTLTLDGLRIAAERQQG
jgi:type III pantothenate kinase